MYHNTRKIKASRWPESSLSYTLGAADQSGLHLFRMREGREEGTGLGLVYEFKASLGYGVSSRTVYVE